MAYQRNADGTLALDGNGDPIPTFTVPEDATVVMTLEDALDPNRTIDIFASWLNQKPRLGGTVQFDSVLRGYDNAVYTVQWQVSADGEHYTDVEGATGTRYCVEITQDNYECYWRVVVTVLDVAGA